MLVLIGIATRDGYTKFSPTILFASLPLDGKFAVPSAELSLMSSILELIKEKDLAKERIS